MAVHVLEHLPDLPATVREMHRLCDPQGVFQIVIPCEGSLAYTLARRISAQRIFEKRYRQSYRWFIEREHINVPAEILGVLSERFEISGRRFFPLPIPFEFCNLVIGLTLTPKP
jgi:2-polyprenyl-3-methyl-5-hydroxy-6-metoxy-1,4-benzoquinol methylase